MGDHLVVNVDHLITPQTVETIQTADHSLVPSGNVSHAIAPSVLAPSEEGYSSDKHKQKNGDSEEEVPLLQMVECRICQEEDLVKNLEIPCACSGSLKVSRLNPNVIQTNKYQYYMLLIFSSRCSL